MIRFEAPWGMVPLPSSARASPAQSSAAPITPPAAYLIWTYAAKVSLPDSAPSLYGIVEAGQCERQVHVDPIQKPGHVDGQAHYGQHEDHQTPYDHHRCEGGEAGGVSYAVYVARRSGEAGTRHGGQLYVAI